MAFGPCGGRGGLGGRGGRGGSRGAAQLAPMINMALTMADALQIFFIHKSFNDVSFAGPAQMAWRTWCRKFSSPGPEVSGYPVNHDKRCNYPAKRLSPANTII